MNTIQEGDVFLFQTPDDGDINVEGGIVEMRAGLESAVYLSLYGGNEEDDASDENRFEWWGNLLENEPAKKYRSRTQYLLRSMPLVTSNLIKVEEAVKNDLAWMVDEGVATSIEVEASIPTVSTLKIAIDVIADDERQTLTFVENWKFEKASQ
jgi:phage gp46-like protein